MALQPGDRFGRYELVSWLGRGGMAETWHARLVGAAGVTKSVLIKKVLPEYAEDEAFISMFISEARISATLSHGNVAQVFDFGRVDGEYFLAMEFVDGQPLHRIIKRSLKSGMAALPVPLATFIALEMCRGLHYAHARTDNSGVPLGIVHRDISPDNVLISYEGQVKIVDFGIAKARSLRSFNTEPGVVKGKYLFFSPEQARGEEVDARTDVWAAGVVLYEMLCGQLPVSGPQHVVMFKMQKGEFLPPHLVQEGIPAQLSDIVMGALAVKREERFESAHELADALASFLYSHFARFNSMSVAHLVRELFRPELAQAGRDLQVPKSFVDEMALWKMGAVTGKVAAVKPAPEPAPRAKTPPLATGQRPKLPPGVTSPTQKTPPHAERAEPFVSTGVTRTASRFRRLFSDADAPPGPVEKALPAVVLGAVVLGAAALVVPRLMSSTAEGPQPARPLTPWGGGARPTPVKRSSTVEAAPRTSPPVTTRVETNPPPVEEGKTSADALAAYVASARESMKQKKYEDALKQTDSCLAIQVDHPDCLLISGSALVYLGRRDQAEERYQRFISAHPDHPMIDDVRRQSEHAREAEKLRLMAEANRPLGKSSAPTERPKAPPPVGAPSMLSAARSKESPPETALASPSADEARMADDLKTFIKQRRPREALAAGKQCLTRFPDNATCLMLSGVAAAQTGEAELGARYYRTFVEKHPDHFAAERVRRLLADYEASRQSR